MGSHSQSACCVKRFAFLSFLAGWGGRVRNVPQWSVYQKGICTKGLGSRKQSRKKCLGELPILLGFLINQQQCVPVCLMPTTFDILIVLSY